MLSWTILEISDTHPGIVEMNLSHIITEFSFGPHFPDIVQPLDNSYEATDKSQFVLFVKLHNKIFKLTVLF